MIRAEPSGNDFRSINPRARDSIDDARRARVATIVSLDVLMIVSCKRVSSVGCRMMATSAACGLRYNANYEPSYGDFRTANNTMAAAARFMELRRLRLHWLTG
jgi:hypothetical protein